MTKERSDKFSEMNDQLIYQMLTQGKGSMAEAMLRTHEQIHAISPHPDHHDTDTDYVFTSIRAYTGVMVGLFGGLTDNQADIMVEVFKEYLKGARMAFAKAGLDEILGDPDLFGVDPYNKDMI